MKKKKIIIGTILTAVTMALALIVMGQNNNNNQQNNKKQLIDRFEKVIKNKEPKFNGGRVGGWDELPLMLQTSNSWKLGESYVNASVFDYYDEKEAKEFIRLNLSENPLSAFKSVAIKLTNLGDEAWLAITDNYNKKSGSTQIMLRKGTVIISIKATSPSLAKRFARYFVREIEKRDRGEP